MLQVGAVLANRYELLEQIGAGGMAVVFRGMDQKLHREVAVKVMREDFIDDPRFDEDEAAFRAYDDGSFLIQIGLQHYQECKGLLFPGLCGL